MMLFNSFSCIIPRQYQRRSIFAGTRLNCINLMVLKKPILIMLLVLFNCNLLIGNIDSTNILLLLIDDLDWKDLRCYEGNFIKTPVALQLAEEGVLFTDAYASPVCSPTRASMISGQNTAGPWSG